LPHTPAAVPPLQTFEREKIKTVNGNTEWSGAHPSHMRPGEVRLRLADRIDGRMMSSNRENSLALSGERLSPKDWAGVSDGTVFRTERGNNFSSRMVICSADFAWSAVPVVADSNVLK